MGGVPKELNLDYVIYEWSLSSKYPNRDSINVIQSMEFMPGTQNIFQNKVL